MGQTKLAGFVCQLAEKENNEVIGLTSNLWNSSIQRFKSNATPKKNKENPQKTLEGVEAEPHCDDGTRFEDKKNSFAHYPTCT